MFKLVWKTNPAKYSYGEICMAGKIKVGSIFQPSVSKGQIPPWRASCVLPGIHMKADTTDFTTREEAKARVERVVATWYKWTQEEA